MGLSYSLCQRNISGGCAVSGQIPAAFPMTRIFFFLLGKPTSGNSSVQHKRALKESSLATSTWESAPCATKILHNPTHWHVEVYCDFSKESCHTILRQFKPLHLPQPFTRPSWFSFGWILALPFFFDVFFHFLILLRAAFYQKSLCQSLMVPYLLFTPVTIASSAITLETFVKVYFFELWFTKQWYDDYLVKIDIATTDKPSGCILCPMVWYLVANPDPKLVLFFELINLVTNCGMGLRISTILILDSPIMLSLLSLA